ncbi:hypothetical protein HUT17_04820 (plasmid) [Nocardiopsis flavescens]|nr:hypothetical protein HUT17_04820 [Nocardiopsis flavescens]
MEGAQMIEVRAALILVASTGCAALTGGLRLAAGASWPDALLAAGAAFGAALGVLVLVVKHDRSPGGP